MIVYTTGLMVIEKKTLIAFDDILAIEYGCRECGSRYTIPIGRFEQAFPKCPNCKSGLASTEGLHPEDIAIKNFVVTLRELVNRPVSKALRLEITNVSDKP
jgi:hypothetical protein